MAEPSPSPRARRDESRSRSTAPPATRSNCSRPRTTSASPCCSRGRPVRQDPLRRVHGLAPCRPRAAARPCDRAPLITVACHEDLTASRPRRPLPARGRRHALDRRAADPRGQGGRDLLPRRGRRGAQGHDRPHPPPHRPPPHAADRASAARSSRRTPTSCSSSRTTRATRRAQGPEASTRQRFIAIEFGYPPRDQETEIIAHESGIASDVARSLAFLGSRLRNLDEEDVIDGPSTRLLVYAGALIRKGVTPLRACDVALVQAVSDDRDVQSAVRQVAGAVFAS